jgi:hypothetical protein
MIKELLYKWFGLTPASCSTCEVLRDQLDKSETERRNLLMRLLDKDKPESSPPSTEEIKAITPQFIPWRVKQQMLEAEDRKRAQLVKEKAKEIEDLEKQLGIVDAGEKRETI